MFFKKKVKENTDPVGGFPFFLSIFCIVIFTINNLYHLPKLFFEIYAEDQEAFKEGLKSLFLFLGCGFLSFALTPYFIKNSLAVFLHEFKHKFLAVLVGNKYKEMKVGKEEGHVVYEFTKKTKLFNAFISLAPYFLPILTFGLLIFTIYFFYNNHLALCAILGFGFGADLYLGFSDIGPHQTDFSNLVGGYYVGLIYAICANLVFLTMLIAFAFYRKEGLFYLFVGLVDVVKYMIPILGNFVSRIIESFKS